MKMLRNIKLCYTQTLLKKRRKKKHSEKHLPLSRVYVRTKEFKNLLKFLVNNVTMMTQPFTHTHVMNKVF